MVSQFYANLRLLIRPFYNEVAHADNFFHLREHYALELILSLVTIYYMYPAFKVGSSKKLLEEKEEKSPNGKLS